METKSTSNYQFLPFSILNFVQNFLNTHTFKTSSPGSRAFFVQSREAVYELKTQTTEYAT